MSLSERVSKPSLVSGPAKDEALRERVRSLRLPAETTAKHRGSWAPWLLVLLLGSGLGYFVYRDYVAEPTTAPRANMPGSATTPVNLGDPGPVASSEANKVVLESKGYIVPAHQILVSPQVNGRIEQLFVEEGRRVARGDVLAELEKIDYKADLTRAEALLAGARAKLLELQTGNRPEEIEQSRNELAETEAQRDQLRVEWLRNQKLRTNRTIADLDYEKSESSYLAMDFRAKKLKQVLALMIEGPRKERIDLAQADVAQAEADVGKSRWRLDNCTIRAPVSGTILKKNAEEGNIVNPVAFNGSYSLCDMADLSDLEVDLAIQERDIAQVYKNQRCEVRSEAYPKRVYQGYVSRLMPIADRAKGAVPVRVKLAVPADEEGVYLKPEMGALVSFLRQSAETVPAPTDNSSGPAAP